MSVVTGAEALAELRRRLFGTVDDGPTYGTTLPADRVSEPVPNWLWAAPPDAPAPTLPPLAEPTTYGQPDALLAASPHAVLGNGSTAEDRQRYCRASADVTMRGGTTSGVVYPLAVCEIARHFRLRNIGGASAGAIAAAAAAAAETGRAAVPPGEVEAAPEGRVRPGFAGLADVVGWLTGLDGTTGSDDADRNRLGRLFQPTAAGRPLFRLVVAAMQERWRWLPLLLLGAFGWSTFLANIAILLLGSLLVARYTFWVDDGLTAAAAALTALVGIGATAAALVLRTRRRPRAQAVPEQVLRDAEPAGRRGWGSTVAAVVAAVAVAAAPGLLVVLLALASSLGFSVAKVLKGARKGRFGLVSGARADQARAARRPDWWDSRAGLEPAEGDRPLLDWLADVLDDLAGLPAGETLRFGHLWSGRDGFRSDSPDNAAALARVRRRRVNLELITTELVHGVPYRFPLQRGEQYDGERPQLYFRREDLCGAGGHIVPRRVVEAMIGASAAVTGHHTKFDKPIDGLYPLPDPWDLPVVFATRLSLSLPGLFQAVRLYRRVPSATLRDEFGRPVLDGEKRLFHPRKNEAKEWFEELWFTDGGVTSNFPIHFFDSLLPLWPTFGINLSGHPTGFAHQDVWLPSDQSAATPPAEPVGNGMAAFLWSIFNTASGWRDATQAAMPAYRSRIAWVRQRPTEGGNNLFMNRETIASLALRGALAGARLRRRFADDPHWHRHQWLRLRIAADNLESLRAQLSMTKGTAALDGLLGGNGAAANLALLRKASTEGLGDPQRDHEWYRPDPGFWPEIQALTALRNLPENPSVRKQVPTPAPELRQVPPA